MSVFDRVHVTPEDLAEFCRRHRIKRLAFFGSVVRGDFGPESDVDVLYEFQPGQHPGLGIVDVCEDLARLLGRRVDFVPFAHLVNPFRRRAILREHQVVYAA